MFTKRLTILALLLLTVVAQASDYESVVTEALLAVDDDLSEHWAYVETSETSEGTFVASFDPRRDFALRWHLELVSGRLPSDDERAEFRARKSSQHEPGDADSGVETIFSPGSIELLEESESHWIFAFALAADSKTEQKFADAVEGRIKVAKEGPRVEYIDMRSSKPFKPAAGIKIKRFKTRLRFAPAYPDGPVVPQSVESDIEGRAMFVMSVKESESIRYSDYERVAD